MKKKRTRGVFTELSEQNIANCILDSFLEFIPHIYGYADSLKDEPSMSKDIQELHAVYLELLNDSKFRKTLNRLADIEHRILQYHCYKSPELTYGLFTQERNGEKSEYIIVRAPFPMRKQTRQELRVYLGKLSDYQGKSLEDLQKDKKFIKVAVEKMKEAMREQMDLL